MDTMDIHASKLIINGVTYIPEAAAQAAAVVPTEDYVIVRSRDQGVMCGNLVDYEGTTVRLNNARQVWRYDGGLCLPDIAVHGLKKGSRLSAAAPGTTVILSACGILSCSKVAAASLSTWEADSVGR